MLPVLVYWLSILHLGYSESVFEQSSVPLKSLGQTTIGGLLKLGKRQELECSIPGGGVLSHPFIQRRDAHRTFSIFSRDM